MMNTLVQLYFKLAELISTFIPSADGMMNELGMKIMDLSNASDPGAIADMLFEIILMMVLIFILYPITLAYRLFMGLIGQPVPVPWF